MRWDLEQRRGRACRKWVWGYLGAARPGDGWVKDEEMGVSKAGGPGGQKADGPGVQTGDWTRDEMMRPF